MLAEGECAGVELPAAGRLQGAGRDRVQSDSEDRKHDQGRQAAPQDQPPADAADEPGIGGDRALIGRVAGRVGGRSVRHC